MKISILGLGRAGGALAIALSRKEFELGPLIVRSFPPTLDGVNVSDVVQFGDIASISADVLVIATGDEDIRAIAEACSTLDEIPEVVMHLSGSLGSEVLESLRLKGVSVGSMHPLVSLSDPILGADRFAGAYFCIEGDEPAQARAVSIVEALGGNHFSVEGRFKPLYHASAVMASGNVVALFHAATEMLAKCGLSQSDAHKVLLPLLRSTVSNLAERPTQDALTGPFARGDASALYRHLEAFGGTVDTRLRGLYLALAEQSMLISAANNREEILDSISIAKRQTEC